MRSLPDPRFVAALALVFGNGCRTFVHEGPQAHDVRSVHGTPLRGPGSTGAAEEPYAERFSVTLRPSLFNLFAISGTFESIDFMSGDPIVSNDRGDIEGKYGVALQVDYQLNSWFALSVGADTRAYDIKGLNPIQELDVSVDSVDSTQFFIATRYLMPPLGTPGWNGSRGRFQPYAEVALNYLSGVEVGFEVDLSEFGSSNLRIESTTDGFFLAGFTAGAFYDLSRRWRLQFGTTYEYPITTMEADLSFEIAGTTVPLQGEFEPLGLIGFVGVTYVF